MAKPCMSRTSPSLLASDYCEAVTWLDCKESAKQGSSHRQELLHTVASTGTRVPARTLVSSGVMKIAPRVEAVVISTESATSPCAMYVATLEAWPPGQQETRIRPTDRAGDRFRTCTRGNEFQTLESSTLAVLAVSVDSIGFPRHILLCIMLSLWKNRRGTLDMRKPRRGLITYCAA